MSSESHGSSPASPQVLEKLFKDLVGWSRLWGLPRLPRQVHIEFNHQLHRSLGRCHVAKGLIRLNGVLLLPQNQSLLSETLCHEAAHMAVHMKHRKRTRPHGPEWQGLMRQAGFPPRTTIPSEQIIGLKSAPRQLRAHYEYRCPFCRTVDRMKVKNSRYRCRTCVEAGRSGHLTIHRLPVSNE